MASERRVGELRDPEVGDLRAVRSEHHVLGLHVAVEDAGEVCDGERAPELPREPRGLERRQATALEALFQVLPDDVFEHEIEPHRVVLSHVVESDEVRVGDPRRRLRLVPHARDELVPHGGREREVVAEDLDRDAAAEHRVPSQPHPPHAALSEQPLDLVTADGARLRGRRRRRGVLRVHDQSVWGFQQATLWPVPGVCSANCGISLSQVPLTARAQRG